MEHYLTYKKLIELIQQNLPIKIKTLSTGDLSYLGKENNPSLYPLMHIVPTQITYNENTTQFTLNILFCDIVNTDMSNEVNVISDMNLSCRDFLSQIKWVYSWIILIQTYQTHQRHFWNDLMTIWEVLN